MMSLVLEVEYLTGTSRAARNRADEEPEWPPQPDRMFSALVSAWAARGEDSGERTALEWLEELPPPRIYAGEHRSRAAPDVYVPPNDAKASTNAGTYSQILPELRLRQPRRFPVAWLEDPILTMAWAKEPEQDTLSALDSIARDVTYVGHSSSFVRCRFTREDVESKHQAQASSRRIYRGRLEELERMYQANPPMRPQPGASVFASEADVLTEQPPDWLVLEHVGSDRPDIRASALVCRHLRRAIMSGYQQIGLGGEVPEEVSGHTPDGKPTRKPHIAIVPMPFSGYEHGDGRVMGFALIPPMGTKLQGLAGFQQAFNNIATYDSGTERRIVNLKIPSMRQPIKLSPVVSQKMAPRSLSTDRYLKPARVWASITPIVLDRHLKRKDMEIQGLIADACANAGLPRPDPASIQAGKHSVLRGSPAAKPLTGEPNWMRWQVPESLATRSLVHAVIDFDQEVEGPVLLGAGRFIGLGLCCGQSALGGEP